MKNSLSTIIISLTLLQSGCSLLLGNVRPVEEKSDSYKVLDLAKVNPDWVRLDPKSSEGSANMPASESGTSDAAFQSKASASIISLNSACKSYKMENEKQDLKALTRELFFGISNIRTIEEKELHVDRSPALLTTVQGKLNGEEMMLRTIVLQRANCVYDLMYISRPERFKEGEEAFSRFVSSLQLR